ncbi:unnamed protein product, partial [Symbiodinium natans]
MWECHDGSNQKFFFDGPNIRTRKDDTCMDAAGPIRELALPCRNGDASGIHTVQPQNGNKIFMSSCPNSDSLQWHFGTNIRNSRQITVGGRCLVRWWNDNDNVGTGNCEEQPTQLWYFSGEQLMTEHDDKCLEEALDTGNLRMRACNGWGNQKFYFDGVYLRMKHTDRCLDYNVETHSAYAGSCPYMDNHLWKFGPGEALVLRKVPLPSSFEHGQSLRASCWSERFTSRPQNFETMSCVAAAWVNSQNKPGLDGFACTACIQVVSKRYAELDSKIKQ